MILGNIMSGAILIALQKEIENWKEIEIERKSIEQIAGFISI